MVGLTVQLAHATDPGPGAALRLADVRPLLADARLGPSRVHGRPAHAPIQGAISTGLSHLQVNWCEQHHVCHRIAARRSPSDDPHEVREGVIITPTSASLPVAFNQLLPAAGRDKKAPPRRGGGSVVQQMDVQITARRRKAPGCHLTAFSGSIASGPARPWAIDHPRP
jgi:hypothetical protein